MAPSMRHEQKIYSFALVKREREKNEHHEKKYTSSLSNCGHSYIVIYMLQVYILHACKVVDVCTV